MSRGTGIGEVAIVAGSDGRLQAAIAGGTILGGMMGAAIGVTVGVIIERWVASGGPRTVTGAVIGGIIGTIMGAIVGGFSAASVRSVGVTSGGPPHPPL